MVGSPQDAKPRLTQSHGPYTTLCTLRFSPSPAPSALEVSTVLFLVHQQAPVYDLIDSQCFWFSDTVWRSLKALFPINQELCNFDNHNSRARYGGFTVGPSDPSVQAVCNAYESEWQRVLKKVEQVKQCHEAELAQVSYFSTDSLLLRVVFLRRFCSGALLKVVLSDKWKSTSFM
jgi:hypothetical protein